MSNVIQQDKNNWDGGSEERRGQALREALLLPNLTKFECNPPTHIALVFSHNFNYLLIKSKILCSSSAKL